MARSQAPGTLYVFRLTVSNAAGDAVGEISAPMLTVPGPPSRLREDSSHRKDDQVMLKFAKHGQHLTHLMLQYAKLEGVGACHEFDRPFDRPFGRPFGRPFDRPFGRPFDRPFDRPFCVDVGHAAVDVRCRLRVYHAVGCEVDAV
jgi:hypothetical protein